jgi:hypothetical protein
MCQSFCCMAAATTAPPPPPPCCSFNLCDPGKSCQRTGRCTKCQLLPASSVPSLHNLVLDDEQLFLCHHCALWTRAIKDKCLCRKWASWARDATLDMRPLLCPIQEPHQHKCVCPRLSNFCRAGEHTDYVI